MRAAETYLGSTIAGRFLIERVLGAGGMGVVFLALDQSSQRRVALKLAMAASDPTRIARFVREGEVSASLDHPGIVRIYSAGAVEGQPYLVYELIEGARELQDVFPQLNLPGRVALVQQVVQALGYAHSRGVVHRDVKPENVLVDHEGRARLADFGIASVAGADRLTATGAWVGTPQYMAPERFQSGAATPASDVWSAGVLLYEALTSTPPFPGKTLQELAPQIALARPTPPSRIVDHVPRRLERVCLRALSADLALRYKDGRAFAEDIERALKDEPLSARPRSKAFLGLAGLLGVGFFGVAVAYALKTPPPASLPSRPPTLAPPSQTPAPAPYFGWRLARGDTFAARSSLRDTWTHLDGPDAGKTVSYLAEIEFDVTVRDLRGGQATLDAKVRRLVLGSNEFKIDSRPGAPSLVMAQHVNGQGFTIFFRPDTGEVRRVLGINAIRQSLIEATLGPVRAALQRILKALNDDAIRWTLAQSLHQFAAGGSDELPSPGPPWALGREVHLTHDASIRYQAKVSRSDFLTKWRLETWEGVAVPRGGHLQDVAMSGEARFEGGRVRSAASRLTCRLRRRGVLEDVVYDFTYEELRD